MGGRRLRRAPLAWLLASAIVLEPGPLEAGSYIFTGAVTHPPGYQPAGEDVVTAVVCVDPASLHSSSMRVPVRNTLAVFNALAPASPNLVTGAANDIPSNAVDFQSILAHELGHCIGLGHTNADQGGLTQTNRRNTKADPGPNTVYDFNAGVDGILGSCDDLRSDDVNLHWFHRQSNNPFLVPAVVDSSTYSRELAHLPTTPAQCSGSSGSGSGPHSFAANAHRLIGARLGFPNTEAVMQQGSSFDEDQRQLMADDVVSLRYGMSGADEVAGTTDDYQFQLIWGGLTTNCDVVVRFDDSATGFGVCGVGGYFVGPTGFYQHIAISTGAVSFNSGFNWYFDQDLSCSLDVDGNGTVEAMTDGVLAMRFLLGFTDSALVEGALGTGATRTTGAAVATYLEGCRYPLLDADGSGLSEGMHDGVVLMRYLLEFRGQALVAGATGAGCTRCTAGEIVFVLDSLLPIA